MKLTIPLKIEKHIYNIPSYIEIKKFFIALPIDIENFAIPYMTDEKKSPILLPVEKTGLEIFLT